MPFCNEEQTSEKCMAKSQSLINDILLSTLFDVTSASFHVYLIPLR